MPCPPTCYGPTATPAFRAPCPRAVRCTDTADAHAKVCRTFGAGRRAQELADSPHARMPAHTGARHRIPRARVPCMWRAAGLLRRHGCGPVRAADALPATRPLAASVRRKRQSGFHRFSTKIPPPCSGRSIGSEAPLTVTFTTVTTGRFGSLHPRPNREACRWQSRPHRASNAHQCLPDRFVRPIFVDDSFNRLKPGAISGEMTTPSGTGACDMRSTGTGSDPVFVHADPRFGPGAVLPPDGDVPQRTDWGHFTISAETSPAPRALVGRETSDYPPLSPYRSRASSIVHRREDSGSHSPPRPNGRQSPRIDSDNDTHGCATVDPLPLTDSRPTYGIDSLTSSAPVTPMNQNRP